jgi:hypothetical protein
MSGSYVLNNVKYEYQVIGNSITWRQYNADGSYTNIQVNVRDKGSHYEYQFGGIWYQYNHVTDSLQAISRATMWTSNSVIPTMSPLESYPVDQTVRMITNAEENTAVQTQQSHNNFWSNVWQNPSNTMNKTD